jgi:hypothetical protein
MTPCSGRLNATVVRRMWPFAGQRTIELTGGTIASETLMTPNRRMTSHFLLASLATLLLPPLAIAQTTPRVAASAKAPDDARHDGQHDFDFEIGNWKTHLKRRVHPLTGANSWVEYDGTTVVRKVWNGAANLVELEVEGPVGRIEGLSLRLYNPDAHQWSLNFSNSRMGTMATPTIGGFSKGRGEFYDQETLNDRAILVRFVISDITPMSVHFEQSYSSDGGKTWEVNWIATDTRIADLPDRSH